MNNIERLINSKLNHVGGGVYELAMLKPAMTSPEPLTYLERAELLTRHRTTLERMNWTRAEAVNQYLQQGATRAEIVAYLRGQDGCGESMIKRDIAALLAAKRKT